jgi:alkylation response protein AidB-like acyl-CoA dehydrogenase
VDLGLSEEQELLLEGFERLFDAESSPARVRAAESGGFDPALWKLLAETGALGLRAPEAAGGAGASLHDAVLVSEAAGRRLVSGPWREAIVAAGLLARHSSAKTEGWLARLLDGTSTLSFSPSPTPALAEGEASVLVPGGAVADAVVGFVDDRLVLVERSAAQSSEPLADLATGALSRWDLRAEPRVVLAEGDAACRAFRAAVAEWRLVTAAALAGLAREALEMAGRYASERVQFDRLIGTFQGVAHPLAESAADIEATRLLVLRAIAAIAGGEADAAARVSMAFYWAAESASTAVARALHTFGGYGLSLEYDIQLYHRRGKAWALAGGDPRDALLEVGDLLWGESAEDARAIALPEAGDLSLDFGLGAEARAMAERVRSFFEETLDDELRAHAHFSWDGHHPDVQRRLAETGLLFPAWPEEWGGRGCGPAEMMAVQETFSEVGWGRHAITTTQMVGSTLMHFASDDLKTEVLPRIARGEAICSLGYTEPEVGSDVAAARCRARREGEEWVIDGQKMFTSGANLAQYIFLLTCTNPEAPKRRGLTMFLVPTDTPGFEAHPIQTISDERTNATYYSSLRLPDRYRIGDVDGGWQVLGYALELEHGAGTYYLDQHDLLDGMVEWARGKRRGGRSVLEDPRVRERLARVAIHTEAAELLGRRSLWGVISGKGDHAAGPMAKFFSTDHFIRDAADMMDLCAPDSLLSGEAGAGAAEFGYRLSTATSIYGGTSEIMRSLVAEVSLGMPRSRI